VTIQRENAAELAGVLDRLAAAGERSIAQRGFTELVQVLDRIAKVNPHQHITGSVGDPAPLKVAIHVYRQDPKARDALLDYVETRGFIAPEERMEFFGRCDDDLVRWFQRQIPLNRDPYNFEEADDRLNLVRFAFQSSHRDASALLQEAYRTVALENAAHGVQEVWFRTSLGDHGDGALERALDSAIAGAKQAEEESGAAIGVRFVLGMRKFPLDHLPRLPEKPCFDTKAAGMVDTLRNLSRKAPQVRRMILGVDSVGAETSWQPEWQASARSAAAGSQLHVAVHFGESWEKGALFPLLERLEALVRHGVIHQLDNANALFAVKDHHSPNQFYADSEWRNIARLQSSIFFLLARRGIALGINPSSNDWLTRSVRYRDGWRFRTLAEPLEAGSPSVTSLILGEGHQANPLSVVVGNDNSRIYPSRVPGSFLTVSEELVNLWEAPGSTYPSVYGKLPTLVLAQLIMNGLALAETTGPGWRQRPSQLEFAFDPDPAFTLGLQIRAPQAFPQSGSNGHRVNGLGEPIGLSHGRNMQQEKEFQK